MSNLVVLLRTYEPFTSGLGEEDSILVIRGPNFGSIYMHPQKKGYWIIRAPLSKKLPQLSKKSVSQCGS